MNANDFPHIQISLSESLLSMGSGDVMRIVHGYAKIIYNRNLGRGGVIHNIGIKIILYMDFYTYGGGSNVIVE
jgi:hypothetical protein